MIQNAARQLLLMKQNADDILAKDEKLQDFLAWYNHLSISIKVPYKPASIRAFYLDFEIANIILFALGRNLLEITCIFDANLHRDFYSSAWGLNFDRAIASILTSVTNDAPACTLALNIAQNIDRPILSLVRPCLIEQIQQLKYQLPSPLLPIAEIEKFERKLL